ncbi:MAG: LacI family DNA-binding transcriptional regulator [Clostridia bacterium]|nr:LacI family DNA-binding transcriptional regulator [Clostridia bacterium]
MSRKVTIHDVAREAGVSAATVSYVINNREDQSISEQTKQKIWHVINMLNYKPSVFAKNLRSSSESKFIAVCCDGDDTLRRTEFVSIVNYLSAAFGDNYGILFMSKPYDKRITNADAIIACDVSKETFYQIGENNYVPLIAFDSLIDDKLFFQITADFDKLKAEAEEHFGENYTFVCITPADVALGRKIEKSFPAVIFVNTLNELASLHVDNVFTAQKIIADFFESKGSNVYFCERLYVDKCNKTVQCVQQAFSREPFDVHFYEV